MTNITLPRCLTADAASAPGPTADPSEVIARLNGARTLTDYRRAKRLAATLTDASLSLVIDALIDARLRVDSAARTHVAADLAWEAAQRR